MDGYNFTERVRKVLAMAREAAAHLHHEYVGTEHLLLALIDEGEGVAATALQNLNVDLDDIGQKIEQTVGRGKAGRTAGPDRPYTSRAKKVLGLAMSHARELNHSYVGTDHLLLGLIAEEEGIAAQILADFGVTLEKARAEILRILGNGAVSPTIFSTPGLFDGAPGPEQVSQSRESVLEYGRRLRKVLAAAQRVATERATSKVTPVHLALALLETSEGVATIALERLGIDIAAATISLNDLAPMASERVSQGTPFDPNPAARRVMHTMLELQQDENAPVPETHHLLMALLAASAEVTSVFSAQGISLIDVRDEARKIVG